MKTKSVVIGCILVLVLLLSVSVVAVSGMRMRQADRALTEFNQSHTYDPQNQSQEPDALTRQRPLADPMVNLMQMLHGMMGVESPR